MSTRTALITGASRGIGLHIARRLAKEGYKLTVSARREPALVAAAAELRDAGVEVHYVVANLAKESQIDLLAAEHAEQYGHLDLLVLNAGVAAEGPVADVSMKTFDLVMGVNLRAQLLLIQRVLPMLRAAAALSPARGAKIVGLASITGVTSEANLSVYGASKAALISLCESVTLEESGRGITASAISPGFVDTDMIASRRADLAAEGMLSADDVAELVVAVSHLSAAAVVPNIVLTRAGNQIWRA